MSRSPRSPRSPNQSANGTPKKTTDQRVMFDKLSREQFEELLGLGERYEDIAKMIVELNKTTQQLNELKKKKKDKTEPESPEEKQLFRRVLQLKMDLALKYEDKTGKKLPRVVLQTVPTGSISDEIAKLVETHQNQVLQRIHSDGLRELKDTASMLRTYKLGDPPVLDYLHPWFVSFMKCRWLLGSMDDGLRFLAKERKAIKARARKWRKKRAARRRRIKALNGRSFKHAAAGSANHNKLPAFPAAITAGKSISSPSSVRVSQMSSDDTAEVMKKVVLPPAYQTLRKRLLVDCKTLASDLNKIKGHLTDTLKIKLKQAILDFFVWAAKQVENTQKKLNHYLLNEPNQSFGGGSGAGAGGGSGGSGGTGTAASPTNNTRFLPHGQQQQQQQHMARSNIPIASGGRSPRAVSPSRPKDGGNVRGRGAGGGR